MRPRYSRSNFCPFLSVLLAGIWLIATFGSTPPAHSLAPSRHRSEQRATDHQDRPYVLLISLDGFRADYLDRFALPNFRRIMDRGVRAKGLIPSFPTKTYPNHYTIVTGLYPEHHGLVANRFFDPARNETYSTRDRKTVQDGTWYRGEPIWVSAEKRGVRAASFFWPGDEAAIQGVRPSAWRPYDRKIPLATGIDTVLEWLGAPPDRRPHLITLYSAEVDEAGHDYGPNSPDLEPVLRKVDQELGRLIAGIDRFPVRDRLFLILVSDHGMAETRPENRIPAETLIDKSELRFAEFGPVSNLFVNGGAARARGVRDEINRKLRHGRAYLRLEVPRRLHFNTDPRIGDVVVIMEEPYELVLPRDPGAGPPKPGQHGWDPSSPAMHGIFLAAGPGVRKGAVVPAFENVQVYPLLGELLGLRSLPRADGLPGWLRRQVLTHAASRAAVPHTALFSQSFGAPGRRRAEG